MQFKHNVWYGCLVIVGILMVMVNTVGIAQEDPAGETRVSGYMRFDADAFGTQI